MPTSGWKHLLGKAGSFQGKGRYPIAAYSEFMPPVWLGRWPSGSVEPTPFAEHDPWGWPVSESEEKYELGPGLLALARHVVGSLARLGRGEPAHGFSRNKLRSNPYWPPELAKHAGALPDERYIVLAPLALSRTQDDKGRVRWTLFGGSEQGPAHGFWKSFQTSPSRAAPEAEALDFIRRLLIAAYPESARSVADLHRAGFRILPQGNVGSLGLPWHDDPLPDWTSPFLWDERERIGKVRYLLTFRPFGMLPASVRRAYFKGSLHLLPFPGSLVPWGTLDYLRLREALPLAMQVPLLHLIPRHEGPDGIRVPQSGWLHELKPGPAGPDDRLGPLRNTFRRTHRNARVPRDVDELGVTDGEDKLAHVLFSSAPRDIGLYNKPMARNAQVWTNDFELVIDGPHATPEDFARAARTVNQGGMFGYRFQYPALRIGDHEVYWHRPLVAFLPRPGPSPVVLPDAPLGYLTAYKADGPDPSRPIELWPRRLDRAEHVAALQLADPPHSPRPRQTARNAIKLLEARRLIGEQELPRSFARQLLTLPKPATLEAWLAALPAHSPDPEQGRRLADEIESRLQPALPRPRSSRPGSYTLGKTARRTFEVAYWKTIASLSTGQFLNKNNADCTLDEVTQRALKHHQRDLERLGDHLIAHYVRLIAASGLTGKALAGSLPFFWRTDFRLPWSGGWLSNQGPEPCERDLLVVIPGRDRSRAVIMADHYDTAYRGDRFEAASGGNGARVAAAGSDDNCSASAALMMAAPVFLELSRAGRLGCDIWLVHLTGEEFPADCLGARHLCQWLIEGDLTLELPDGRRRDLSKTRAQGVYVLDMVAHNNDRDRDVFQIAPGASRESFWLAYQAHRANAAWNDLAPTCNQRPSRRGRPRSERSADPARVPAIAPLPTLYGEVRLHDDPRSTLYNTDGQIFSDAGIPVVLFMEDYDINRTGYHDSHDTMANIDLDYGAALVSIAIETVARAASEEPLNFST